jgi:hypothetical protein
MGFSRSFFLSQAPVKMGTVPQHQTSRSPTSTFSGGETPKRSQTARKSFNAACQLLPEPKDLFR